MLINESHDIYNYSSSNIFARAQLVLTGHVGEYSPADTARKILDIICSEKHKLFASRNR